MYIYYSMKKYYLGHAPDLTVARPQLVPAPAQPFTLVLPATAPYAAGPPAPVADSSAMLPPLAAQATSVAK